MALKFRKSGRRDRQGAMRSALGDAELPSFPAIVLKTLELIRDPKATATDIARTLSADPELSVRILRLVNSGAFGSRRPITAIDQAVAMAGTGAVESLALSVGVSTSLARHDLEGFDQLRFWRTASRRAVIAKLFAQRLHPEISDLCFTAGFLQDMAIPLLVGQRHDYRTTLSEWYRGGGELHILEGDKYGWNHAELAGWLCEEWSLPGELTELVAHHHDDHLLPAALRLAAYCQQREDRDEADRIVALASEEFGLVVDDVVEILNRAETESESIARLFG